MATAGVLQFDGNSQFPWGTAPLKLGLGGNIAAPKGQCPGGVQFPVAFNEVDANTLKGSLLTSPTNQDLEIYADGSGSLKVIATEGTNITVDCSSAGSQLLINGSTTSSMTANCPIRGSRFQSGVAGVALTLDCVLGGLLEAGSLDLTGITGPAGSTKNFNIKGNPSISQLVSQIPISAPSFITSGGGGFSTLFAPLSVATDPAFPQNTTAAYYIAPTYSQVNLLVPNGANQAAAQRLAYALPNPADPANYGWTCRFVFIQDGSNNSLQDGYGCGSCTFTFRTASAGEPVDVYWHTLVQTHSASTAAAPTTWTDTYYATTQADAGNDVYNAVNYPGSVPVGCTQYISDGDEIIISYRGMRNQVPGNGWTGLGGVNHPDVWMSIRSFYGGILADGPVPPADSIYNLVAATV